MSFFGEYAYIEPINYGIKSYSLICNYYMSVFKDIFVLVVKNTVSTKGTAASAGWPNDLENKGELSCLRLLTLTLHP